jgi:catalase
VHGYSRDGQMNSRLDGDPVYAPNSYGGSQADPDRYPEPSYEVTGEIVRTAYHAHKDDNDFVQPGTMYREVMSETDRDHLLGNIIGHASHGPGLDADVARRVGEYWGQVDSDLGTKVAKALS